MQPEGTDVFKLAVFTEVSQSLKRVLRVRRDCSLGGAHFSAGAEGASRICLDNVREMLKAL